MTCFSFRFAMLFLGALAVTAAGCGRAEFTFYPVEGTVIKGGHPLRDIEVVFLADPVAGTVGPRASGITDETGHYRLRSERGDDGAVAGKHLILIRDLKAAEKQLLRRFRRQLPKGTVRLSPEMAKHLQDELKPAADAPRVPPSYERFNETPLRAEIHPGPQTLDFDIP